MSSFVHSKSRTHAHLYAHLRYYQETDRSSERANTALCLLTFGNTLFSLSIQKRRRPKIFLFDWLPRTIRAQVCINELVCSRKNTRVSPQSRGNFSRFLCGKEDEEKQRAMEQILMEVEKTLKAIRLVIRSSHDSTRMKRFVVLIKRKRKKEKQSRK